MTDKVTTSIKRDSHRRLKIIAAAQERTIPDVLSDLIDEKYKEVMQEMASEEDSKE